MRGATEYEGVRGRAGAAHELRGDAQYSFLALRWGV